MMFLNSEIRVPALVPNSWRDFMRMVFSGVPNRLIVTAGVLGIVAGAAEASSPNLTGTWKGQAVCDELVAGRYTFHIFTDDSRITQVGDHVRATANGIVYEGTAQQLDGGSSNGETVLHACDGIPAHETVRIQHIDTTSWEKSEVDGNTLYESKYFFPGAIAFGTCKLTYTRVYMSNPNITRCQ